MRFSCIIPCRNPHDPQLQRLLQSIRAQTFDQAQIETLVISQGNSEQAKAIGILQARGDLCAMFCADNVILKPELFTIVDEFFRAYPRLTGCYDAYYAVVPGDTSLNRYCALLGANDPVPVFLGKADRLTYTCVQEEVIYQLLWFRTRVPSLGDNGFFFRRAHLLQADLDAFYPPDACEDLRRLGYAWYVRVESAGVQHATAPSLRALLGKRYRYARDLYLNEFPKRRWRMITRRDLPRLLGFIVYSLTLVGPCWFAWRGYRKVRDWAWWWHPLVCLAFLGLYGWLTVRHGLPLVWSSVRSIATRPISNVTSLNRATDASASSGSLRAVP